MVIDKKTVLSHEVTSAPTVLILPGCTDTSAVKMFENRGWRAIITKDLEDVKWFKEIEGDDLKAICFMGGTDVDPAIYGEERGPTTQTPDKKRDAFEVAIFEEFKDTDVYLFGICRGAQLLNVLNGGKMIQECGYRGGEVDVVGSNLIETVMGLPDRYLRHNVCHHQGMKLGDDFDRDLWVESSDSLDYLIHYPKTRSYGVQGHPEWGHKETEDLFFAGIDLVMKGN